MMRRILVVGVTTAAIVGAGTGALALTGQSDTSGTPSAGSAQGHDGKNGEHEKGHAIAKALRHHIVHGQIVTKGKDGYVRRDGVAGTVSAVSSTSITVKASDGYSETFTVTKDTKVRKRTSGKGSPSTISAVKSGDTVAVLGKADSEHGQATARIVVDGVTR